jgi:hypothetical protein
MKTRTRLPWLERVLRPLAAPAPPGEPVYSVAVWCGDEEGASPDDHGPFGFVEVARCRLGALRRVLPRLRALGWSDVSLRVDREDETPPA